MPSPPSVVTIRRTSARSASRPAPMASVTPTACSPAATWRSIRPCATSSPHRVLGRRRRRRRHVDAGPPARPRRPRPSGARARRRHGARRRAARPRHDRRRGGGVEVVIVEHGGRRGKRRRRRHRPRPAHLSGAGDRSGHGQLPADCLRPARGRLPCRADQLLGSQRRPPRRVPRPPPATPRRPHVHPPPPHGSSICRLPACTGRTCGPRTSPAPAGATTACWRSWAVSTSAPRHRLRRPHRLQRARVVARLARASRR